MMRSLYNPDSPNGHATRWSPDPNAEPEDVTFTSEQLQALERARKRDTKRVRKGQKSWTREVVPGEDGGQVVRDSGREPTHVYCYHLGGGQIARAYYTATLH